MSDDGMRQMSDVVPTFDLALATIQAGIDDVRRELSGSLMSRFPQRWWMLRRAKRLRKELGTGSVEFNALCDGQQVTICSSETTRPKAIPQAHSLCVVTVAKAEPIAVNDVLADPAIKNHPASAVCRAWASYPVMVNGTAAGTVCALDSPSPRAWNRHDEAALEQAALELGARIAAWLNT